MCFTSEWLWHHLYLVCSDWSNILALWTFIFSMPQLYSIRVCQCLLRCPTQGSVLGPMLFTAYVAPVGRLISHAGIDLTTSMQTISTFTPVFLPVQPILHSWCCAPATCSTGCGITCSSSTQTSLSLLCSELGNAPGWPTHVAVAGSDIKMSDHLKVLGVTLDSSMTLDTQVTATVWACNFHLQSLWQLQSSLPRDVAQSVTCAIIGSWLAYCKSLCYGMSHTNFQRLHRVQNAAARIVCRAPWRQHHSADLFKDLHWLPVRGRVDYKIAVLCYKAVKLQQPSYLTGLLLSYRQSRVLRSSTSDLLSTQSSLTNIAARRFSCCAPTVWNSLPSFACTADSFTSFR